MGSAGDGRTDFAAKRQSRGGGGRVGRGATWPGRAGCVCLRLLYTGWLGGGGRRWRSTGGGPWGTAATRRAAAPTRRVACAFTPLYTCSFAPLLHIELLYTCRFASAKELPLQRGAFYTAAMGVSAPALGSFTPALGSFTPALGASPAFCAALLLLLCTSFTHLHLLWAPLHICTAAAGIDYACSGWAPEHLLWFTPALGSFSPARLHLLASRRTRRCQISRACFTLPDSLRGFLHLL